ncbi:MAG: hypothetical protein ACRD2L_09480 [Terriglobia bacterium]
MNAAEFVLSLVDISGGIEGRTLLQKRAFFVELLTDVDIDLGFDAHYYGPYSQVVDSAMTALKNLGFIKESSTGFGMGSGGFEMRRYDYSLTDDGNQIVKQLKSTAEYKKIGAAIKRMRDSGDPNYVELSIAAKAFFVLKKKGKPMSCAEMSNEAGRFNWDLKPESIARAVDFLKKVGLATGQ